MQHAENDSDAFFRFTPGRTSLFAVFAAESLSARFSGARNGCYVEFLFYGAMELACWEKYGVH